MTLEMNEALARRYFGEALAEGKYELLDELVSSHYENHDPTNPPDLPKGPAPVRRFMGAITTAFPDARVVVEAYIPAVHHVTVRWRMRGTHRGDFAGVAPSGRKIDVTGISLLRMESGMIAEQWDHWDMLGLMAQIGAGGTARPGAVTYLPDPAEAAKEGPRR